MNKKVIIPAIVLALLGGGVFAATSGSDTPEPAEQASVQGTSDTANNDESPQTPATEVETATQTQATTPESTTSSQTQATTDSSQTTSELSSTDTTPTTADNGSDAPDAPTDVPTTRGDQNDADELEVIDVVPVPVDDGGPTIDPTPVRGGSVNNPPISR